MMRSLRRLTVLLASVLAASLLVLAPTQPAGASADTAQTFTGFAHGEDLKEWFNTDFGFDAGRLGAIQGRIRFVTETFVDESATRTLSTGVSRSFDAGQNVLVRVQNHPGVAQLVVRSRPALQILFEWQPEGDPFECDVDTFPDFGEDEWFRYIDDGGPVRDGVCGAIEVTADDLNPIFEQLGIDLELPEVFDLINQEFTPQFSGTQTIEESHELFEIKVCKIATDFFALPLGDRCGLQINAVIRASLVTAAQSVSAQACTSAFTPQGTEIPCATDLGDEQRLTYTDSSRAFVVPGVCTQRPQHYDVRLSNLRWEHGVEDVTVGLSVDFNVRLREGGDGWDLAALNVPGSISLIDDPIPMAISFLPLSEVLHVGQVSPDDDPPTVSVQPQPATVDEGSTITMTATVTDLCTPDDQVDSRWTVDGLPIVGSRTTISRGYPNDLPDPTHEGTVKVTDLAGNTRTVPFQITVRNVKPGVTLNLPKAGVAPIGTAITMTAPVTDPGSDTISWHWNFGDGTFVTRNATGVSDRTDSREKTYGLAGLYDISLTVGDGAETTRIVRQFPVFDPASKLVGTATFVADDQAAGVPRGSNYQVNANLKYRAGELVPTGTFTTSFTRIVDGQAQPATLAATGFEWYLERPSRGLLQGFATVNGTPGWKFRLDLARDGSSPLGSVATFSVWRPGVTTLENPDYLFGGPRDTGNLA